jgi:predicted SnoaL-like aldol condensation-catalyzing enzyme
MRSNKHIIIEALQALITHPEHNETEIAAFFAPGYQQTVDGKTLDYREFVHHMATLKTHTRQMSITINAIVAEGDTVFTHHRVDVEKADGEKSHFEVFARFTLFSEKIIRCEELTRMIGGHPSDRDLGSRK